MATTKKAAGRKSSKGGSTAKKSSKASSGAAKKGSKAAGAGSKAAGAKGRVEQGKCSGWAAWHDRMPGVPQTLYVTGKCEFPSTGYKVKLVKASPQGKNPAYLLLNKVVTPPGIIRLPVKTTVEVRYELRTKAKYTNVTILPDVVTVKVEEVS
ncbi:MAG TPA: hypothetical protein VM934_05240 [Pyrinomonadaceae bacterium]|jgi:hypothetical protein|nr:hypothetical protein [Pyrinomonadaceae bacterium]